MSPDIIILLLGLVALMALGIPICFAMMSVASVILLVFYGSGLLNVLNAAFVYQMQSESLLAIPMFALMAAFLQTSGIGGDIYEFFHKWLGGINGGLAMATVATTAVIAAMSGPAVHHLYRHPLCHQSQAGPRHPQGRASLLGREDAGV